MTNYALQNRHPSHPRVIPYDFFSFSNSFLDFSIIADFEEIVTIEHGHEIITRPTVFMSYDNHMHTNRGTQNISGYDIFFENERRLDAYIAKLETECAAGRAIPQRINENLSGELKWYLSQVNEKVSQRRGQLQKRLDGFYLIRAIMKPDFDRLRQSQEYRDYLATTDLKTGVSI